MMRLQDGRKRFKIGLAVLIQYRRVMDRHQPRFVGETTPCFEIFDIPSKNDSYKHGFAYCTMEKNESVKTGNYRCGLRRLRELVAVIGINVSPFI